jgi:flagellar biosynthesis protein FliR
LSFPVTIAGGLIVLSLGMPFTVSLIGSQFEQLQLTIEALLGSLGRG